MTTSDYSQVLDQPFTALVTALTSKDYWDYDAKKLTPVPGEVTTFESTDAHVKITIVNDTPSEYIPDMAKRFVPESLNITRTITFTPDTESFASAKKLTGKADIQLAKIPVTAGGDITVAPQGDSSSTFSADVDINVNIPIIGPRIADAATPGISKVFERETELLTEWIKNN